MNTVEELLRTPFCRLTLEDKLQVKEMGPDRPVLTFQQSTSDRGRKYRRKCCAGWYDRKNWLCGSVTKTALFCFPCLLFGGDQVWTQTGVRSLKHFASKIKKHEASKTHLKNCVQLKMLGRPKIVMQLNERYSLLVRKHNEEVENNRYILSKIIACILSCDAFDLALRGYDKTEESTNPAVFRGLVSLMASIKIATERHLQCATVFRGLSKTILNELLDCMLMVAKDHIKQQLKSTCFAAVQVDDTTDVSTSCQNVLIFRYISEDGSLVERFYGFTELEECRAETIAAALLQQLNEIFPEETDRQKLISQSYDMASVMQGDDRGVQMRIHDMFPNAKYVHCYAHQLNLVMQKAASQIKEVRIFFSDLSAFSAFFVCSAKRKAALEAVVKRRLLKSSQTCWHFNIQTVSVVFEKRLELIECFKEIRTWEFDRSAVREARGFLQMLEDGEFLYFLSLFHRVMLHVDILHSQLQATAAGFVAVRKAILDFVSAISSVRNSIGSLFVELPQQSQLPRGKTKATLERVASEVCDIIIADAKERFAFTSHLASATLVQGNLFPAHNQRFPQQAFDETIDAYPVLKKDKLKTELSILYKRQEFYCCKDASTLLHVLLENTDLENTLAQTGRLLRILNTTPMRTAETERTCSALKRIKTFLQNTLPEERRDALAMLSIEKWMITEIPDFSHRTIELFARQKEHRLNFLFKK
ncbi:zinc finger MYM-type protein 1-like [Hemicordylus capensis]|uniref:zinc finger MYM-type protein 1-like n=1 Tax=Hemicordylus capensis TaxID=884348 RepID=UPI002304A370|nr:zinc finger MYM-type protein 1-like [Hemicordylus capensis]XP_053140776.1 zinc finger MYM-type protein 1-like [Hemicordylus capensis]